MHKRATSKITIVLAVAVAATMGIILTAAAQAASPSATRSFSATAVSPGADVTVTIAVADYGGFGRVIETLPTGFSYVSSSLDDFQVTELAGNQVRFTLQGDTSFTYTVTASGTPGPRTFSGTFRDDMRMDHTVGGATAVTVRGASAMRTVRPSSVTPGATVTLPPGFSYVESSPDYALTPGRVPRILCHFFRGLPLVCRE